MLKKNNWKMSDDCLEIVIKCTNMAGRERFPLTWPTLDKAGILHFIGVIFHMDENRRSDMTTYWSKANPDPFVKNSGISACTFLLWYGQLSLYDAADYSSAEKLTNKIYKVDTFLTSAQKAMQKMRHTTRRELSLNEEMTTFKVLILAW